jgi:hypothetical protein
MKLNLTRTRRYSSKPHERFADQRLLFRANGRPVSQAAPKCKDCEGKTYEKPAMKIMSNSMIERKRQRKTKGDTYEQNH